MRRPRPVLEGLLARLGAAPGEPLPLGEPAWLAELEAVARGQASGNVSTRHATAAALLSDCLGAEPPASASALRLALEALALSRAIEARAASLREDGALSETRRAAALEACLTRARHCLAGLPGLTERAWILAPLEALAPDAALAA
jgi:hypothetical protein